MVTPSFSTCFHLSAAKRISSYDLELAPERHLLQTLQPSNTQILPSSPSISTRLYIPDSPKAQILTMTEMAANSVFALSVRALCCIIIPQKSGVALAAVLGGEMPIYLLSKGIRSDFSAWLPIYGP